MPLPRPHPRTLKSKLLQVTVATLLAMTAVTLTIVAWTHYAVEERRSAEIEGQIRDSITSKATALTTSHAFALKGLVADHAFGDVRLLIASAVEGDAEIVYGLFIGDGGELWAYVSPSSPSPDQSAPKLEQVLGELSLSPDALTARSLAQRQVNAFGQQLLECRAAVIGDNGEVLGTIIYGVSLQRTRTAVAAARRRSEEALAQALGGVVVAGLLSFLAGVVWMRRSAGKITEPVEQLTQAAHKIAAGERGVRVRVESQDELELLAAAFNHMLEANERAMRELEATTARALAADRLKSEFLANMSHEIRTPMNGVLGMIKLIQRQPLDGRLRRYVETIAVSADALLTVINDILDFSKLEAGKYEIRQDPFDLKAVVQDVAELLAGKAHDKGVQLIYRIAPGFPDQLIGDPDRFRQVLNNLVGNAVKFTDQGEVFVDVKLTRRQAAGVIVEVSVQDTGIGIAAAELPRLWDAFTQADGTAERRHGGTGLGLAICKRLVAMMNGEIWASSEPGRGSTFSFTVAVQADAGSAQPAADLPMLPGKRILLVEPHPRWREVVREHVLAWQMICETTGSLADALALANAQQSRPFDAIVLSAEALDSATDPVAMRRQHPLFSGIPLVLLTTHADPRKGAHDHLVFELPKPLRLSDLYNCLAGTLLDPSEHPRERSRLRSIRPAGKPVLVVDDNEINRLVAVEELHDRGFPTEEAQDGLQAVEKFRTGRYLCVLMDCQMPRMDGYEATRVIRAIEAEEGRERTPIVALTAHAFTGERERVLSAGMDDYLSKPFRPSMLDKLLRAHVNAEPQRAPAAVQDLSPHKRRSKRLIELFLVRMPVQLAELEDAISRGGEQDVRAHAHKLKGSCLALCASRMAEAAEAVRSCGAERDFVGAASAMRELRGRFSTVSELLRKELEDRSGERNTTEAGT